MHGPFFIDFIKLPRKCALSVFCYFSAIWFSHSMHNEFVWIHSVIQALQSTQPNTYTHLVKRHKFGTSLVRKNIFVITHLIHKRKKNICKAPLIACAMYVTTGHTVCWTDDGRKESFYTFFSMNVGFYISSLWHMLWLAFVFFLFRHFEAVAVSVCVCVFLPVRFG